MGNCQDFVAYYFTEPEKTYKMYKYHNEEIK